ncbi:pyruvate synthase subunit PorB [Thermoproteus tenax]|uniref:2-oxoacid oxidoreductase (ferredoxin) n=2 Tax=Thermoproteus tenax TaxID=2271 RepID=G4RM51_THETK|nr:pyruvate synthase subunit PorB [Thermoproteus tenax]CAF18507.1 putative 2-oxoglutarate synthase, 2-oxoacid-ferredoxin oxidoreductases beta subunit [Thermoproteus tenax]CCC82646.1 2-oxoacid ferredoxin oxidoreductase, beta subunit [Thermoproteus tenax Kra 1]
MRVVYRGVWDLPAEELFASGHRACAGCGPAIAMRWITKTAGANTIVVNATGCMEVTTTQYPETAWMLPYLHVAFENAAAAASGVESAVRTLSKKGLWKSGKTNVIVVAGDGGTYDIGLQSLSGMLERRHHVLYILYDNEAYMNTGIQRSGSTPKYAWTTTTPVGKAIRGKIQEKKDIMGIVMAHRVPYAATASISNILDMANKIKTALEYTEEGPTFLHILAPCPPGWRFPEERTVEVARLAVETGYFPLYEYDHGKIKLNPPTSAIVADPKRRKPLKEFLKMQGRFAHLTDAEIEELERAVLTNLEYLSKLASL